ncbi:MAG: hypothetical protein IT373_33790 [Polyangiaceae bacterium]|nr:hypothetical protein [Polyangiaceae bacterium]
MSVGEATGSGTCDQATDPLNPIIVELPGTTKVQLDLVSRRGLVAVVYTGCSLKVLNACEIEGGYEFTSVQPQVTKMALDNMDQLAAGLPLGVATIGGQIGGGQKFELDYVLVGERRTTQKPGKLGDNCEGATHYVRNIMIGSYALDTKAEGKAGIGVEVSDIGVSASHSEHEQQGRGSGDLRACAKATALTVEEAEKLGCAAPVQLGLVALGAK